MAGISSRAAANRFLEDVFIPFWNQRFTVPPAEPVDAHRALPKDVDLLRLFAETEERVIRSDFTFRYKNQHYQIEEAERDEARPKTRVVIERRLDGSLRFRWKEAYLNPLAIAEPPKPAPLPKPAPKPRPRRAGRPIPADHPWRKHPIRVGRALRVSSNVASRAFGAPAFADLREKGG